MKIYKIYYPNDDDSPAETYAQTSVLDESGLKEYFKQAIQDEIFNGNTINRFDLSKPEIFTADEIAQIYEYDGYLVDIIELKD